MKQWVVAKLNKERATMIAKEYGLPPIIATLLDIRGITTQQEIENFLYDESFIDNPFKIKDMDKACQRIKSAIDNNEKICVYGDYDADGVTSTALLYSYLETVGADVMYYIPSRENEGYGMNKNAIDILKRKCVDLIITVDNGISAIEEIEYANQLGIDTVVTDHHQPSEQLPDAVAVVDLHRKDCDSSFKLLSGVGVAFKLVYALEGEFADLDMLLDNYSDLVSLGTIGDIVPLLSENRVFVKRGLANLANSDRAGISSLIEDSGLNNKELTSGNISFTLVPRINAVGRLGLSQSSLSLLLSEDYDFSRQMAQKLGEDNAERQKIEKDILSKIDDYIKLNPQVVRERVIIIPGEGWHQGVIGIVSSKIKDIYDKPCIILSKVGDVYKGSGRSIDGFDLWSALDNSGHLLVKYGGHPMAVGLTISSENVEAFCREMNDFAMNIDNMPYGKLKIDCKLNPKFINVDLAKELKYLQPYGAGNPTPVFQLSDLKITNIISISNDKHLKLQLSRDNCNIIAMYFFHSKENFQYVVGDTVDLAVTLDVNEYKNIENLSMIIKDIKFAGIENEDYLASKRIFEDYITGKKVSKEKLKTIIPSRDDFALVYRYLKSNSHISDICIETLCYRLNNKLPYGKIQVILQVMAQLRLVELTENIKNFRVTLLDVSNKVDIESAPLLQQLKEEYISG